MSASCLLQGREKNVGFCRFVVKTTCVFAVKTAKNGSKHGARMVQPWYGLGAEKVNKNQDDTSGRYNFFCCRPLPL